jgi:hypothetical protein
VDEETAAAHMRGSGVPEVMVEVILGVYRAQRLGAYEQVSDAVPQYLGRPARSVTAFLADHRELFAPRVPSPQVPALRP